MKGIRILRQIAGIDALFMKHLFDDGRVIEYQDGTQYVDNDKAFDAVIANEVVRHTVGFILADEQGGKLAGPWRSLDKAEAARTSAKVEFVSVVDAPPADDDPATDAAPEPAAASEGGGALAVA